MVNAEARALAFEAERRHLFGVAYRMLGSAAEAEDIVQEASMRYLVEESEIDSPRAFLTTVVVRLCLDHAKSARSRRESYVGAWLPEPLLDRMNQLADVGDDARSAAPAPSSVARAAASPEARVELAESLSLAFMTLLERLSPLERAAFLLREVFDQSFAEIAGALGTSEPATRQLVSRARAHIDLGRPRFLASTAKKQELLSAFVTACATGDAESLSSLLSEDVVARSDGGGRVTATLKPVVGRDRVSRFVVGVARKAQNLRAELTSVNGEPGLLLRNPEGRIVVACAIAVAGDRISEVLMVLNPDKLPPS